MLLGKIGESETVPYHHGRAECTRFRPWCHWARRTPVDPVNIIVHSSCMSWMGSIALVHARLLVASEARMETSGRSCQPIVASIMKTPYQHAAHLGVDGEPKMCVQIISVMAIGSLSVPSGSTYPFSHDPAAATVWEKATRSLASLSTVDGHDGSDVWRQQRMVTCGTRRRRLESGVLTP